MKTKKFLAVILSLALVLTLLSGCGGGGNEGGEGGDEGETIKPIVLRLASDAPLEHIATGLNNGACEKVKERTDGRVEVQYYPASQLGSYETVYEEIVIGSVDIAQITVPDALDSRLGAAYLPYYATSFDEAKILYAPDSYISSVFSDLTAENGVRFMGWVLEGFIG
ncbi:MAG: hypothetical protein MJA31_14295, partial [Clostridia bacterium]|nr:hypothetical protein [Clostridia bacterium]